MKWIAEVIGITIGLVLFNAAWIVWMENKKPECIVPAIPILTSVGAHDWHCAVMQNPDA